MPAFLYAVSTTTAKEMLKRCDYDELAHPYQKINFLQMLSSTLSAES